MPRSAPRGPDKIRVFAVTLTLLLAVSASLAQTPAAQKAATTAPLAETGPEWTTLSPEQKTALQPLAASWPGLNATQKRKWIALSRNYPKMPAEEQARLHSRMSSWAALSPAERTQARLNFSESRTLKPQDRKAQWEAYQALTPEQKKELAQRRPPKASGASVAVDGSTKSKLATAPETGSAQPPAKGRKATPARVLIPQDGINANTLLPQQPGASRNSSP